MGNAFFHIADKNGNPTSYEENYGVGPKRRFLKMCGSLGLVGNSVNCLNDMDLKSHSNRVLKAVWREETLSLIVDDIVGLRYWCHVAAKGMNSNPKSEYFSPKSLEIRWIYPRLQVVGVDVDCWGYKL